MLSLAVSELGLKVLGLCAFCHARTGKVITASIAVHSMQCRAASAARNMQELDVNAVCTCHCVVPGTHSPWQQVVQNEVDCACLRAC